MKGKLRDHFLDWCSSVKQFIESFVDLAPDAYKHYKWKTPFVLLFVFVASIAYFIYQKLKKD